MKKQNSQDDWLKPELVEKDLTQSFLVFPMPTEVNATNLELKAGEAAMKAARKLNEKYRSSCVEVLRKTQTNARDGGEDIEVLFDPLIWTSPKSFAKEFEPLYRQLRSEQ